jgi:MFS family permease
MQCLAKRLVMITRFRSTVAGYPRQYWVLFWGLLISSIGGGLWWPFLTIYMRERLAVPLTTITLLFTLNAAAGLVAMSIAGPAVDRFGRRFAMIIGLVSGGLILLAMSTAQTLPVWALLMLLQGLFNPFYRVGSDAMVADLIPPARRAGAYALLRMINNLGIAIGPAIGGFVAGVSYSLAFYVAAAANLLFVTLIALFVRETLPRRTSPPFQGASASDGPQAKPQKRDSGYGPVLRDRPFVALCGVFVLATMPAAIMMMLLAVYAKENAENHNISSTDQWLFQRTSTSSRIL